MGETISDAGNRACSIIGLLNLETSTPPYKIYTIDENEFMGSDNPASTKIMLQLAKWQGIALHMMPAMTGDEIPATFRFDESGT